MTVIAEHKMVVFQMLLQLQKTCQSIAMLVAAGKKLSIGDLARKNNAKRTFLVSQRCKTSVLKSRQMMVGLDGKTNHNTRLDTLSAAD